MIHVLIHLPEKKCTPIEFAHMLVKARKKAKILVEVTPEFRDTGHLMLVDKDGKEYTGKIYMVKEE